MASIARLSCSSYELTDEQLLLAALRGERPAWAKLFKHLDRFLVLAVRRRAPDLPDDLRRDVIQEIWAGAAARPDGDFDPSADSAQHYVAGFLGLALDRVRAAYRAPGQRSRWRDAVRCGAHPRQTPVVVMSFDELDENEEPEDPRSQVERDRVEATIDIRRAQALASPLIARAIDVMWERDLAYGAAAAVVGINRLTLRRQLLQLGCRLVAA